MRSVDDDFMRNDIMDGSCDDVGGERTALEDVGVLLADQGLSDAFFLERGLVKYGDAEAGNLVVVQVDEDGREHELVTGAGEAWLELRDAAQAEGVLLEMVSAYRSVERQAEIVRGKFLRGLGVDEIFAVSAAPGFSEHHTGRAVDISTPGYGVLEEEFEESAAFGWLEENAGRYGFTMTYGKGNAYGYLYEPWHWVWG